MENRAKPVWIFGNAVQDITVDIDLDRLSRERANARELIRLTQTPEINRKLWLITRKRRSTFAVQFTINNGDANADGFQVLNPGGKYTLKEEIADSDKNVKEPALFVPCESISWGGGGVNVASFLRTLAPDPECVPIRYTDVAMSRTVPVLLREFHKLCHEYGDEDPPPDSSTKMTTHKSVNLWEKDPARFELLVGQAAKKAAKYAPDRSLEVYLASLPVDFLLYRPQKPHVRRNWVFSRIHSIDRDTENKIICRGACQPLDDAEEPGIVQLLSSPEHNAGAFLLNSLRDGPLFKAAYSRYKKAWQNDNNVVGMLAMTEAMQEFTDWLVKDKGKNGTFPPFILVFNETEAWKFARRFDPNLKPFMAGPDDVPNMREFAKLAKCLQGQFQGGGVPRIYVTLGSRGSLGVGEGHVVYVSCFSKPRATVYDTNACGDAYSAAILLMEWAKRNGYQHIAKIDDEEGALASAMEMRYFMAVATAVAYCKATNRRGEVDQTGVVDLLEYGHLASAMLAAPRELISAERPQYVDDQNRLQVPPHAHISGTTDQLKKLMALIPKVSEESRIYEPKNNSNLSAERPIDAP